MALWLQLSYTQVRKRREREREREEEEEEEEVDHRRSQIVTSKKGGNKVERVQSPSGTSTPVQSRR